MATIVSFQGEYQTRPGKNESYPILRVNGTNEKMYVSDFQNGTVYIYSTEALKTETINGCSDEKSNIKAEVCMLFKDVSTIQLRIGSNNHQQTIVVTGGNISDK